MMIHLRTIFWTTIFWIVVVLGVGLYLGLYKIDVVKKKLGIDFYCAPTTAMTGITLDDLNNKLDLISNQLNNLSLSNGNTSQPGSMPGSVTPPTIIVQPMPAESTTGNTVVEMEVMTGSR